MIVPPNFAVTAHGDREIRITRDFQAPKRLVFEAWTKPELVRRWLLGPDGWTMPVCTIDFRVGGSYRYEWEKKDIGAKMAMGGTFLAISPPDRIESTELFDDPWYPGGATNTLTLSERAGVTTMAIIVRYQDRATRDAVLQSPMESGLRIGFDRLANILGESAAS